MWGASIQDVRRESTYTISGVKARKGGGAGESGEEGGAGGGAPDFVADSRDHYLQMLGDRTLQPYFVEILIPPKSSLNDQFSNI